MMEEWFRIRGPKRKVWIVNEATSEEVPAFRAHAEGGETAGYVSSDGEVWIRKDDPYADPEDGRLAWSTLERNKTMLHELCHVAMEGVPKQWWVRRLMKRHPSKWGEEMEEIVIRALAPRLYPMLVQLGFKPPPRRGEP